MGTKVPNFSEVLGKKETGPFGIVENNHWGGIKVPNWRSLLFI